MIRRSCRASRTTSRPSTVAVPESGLSSVVRIRTVVVLPAPLGPSKPSTVPSATVRSRPSSAVTSPYVLTRPSATIAFVIDAPRLVLRRTSRYLPTPLTPGEPVSHRCGGNRSNAMYRVTTHDTSRVGPVKTQLNTSGYPAARSRASTWSQCSSPCVSSCSRTSTSSTRSRGSVRMCSTSSTLAPASATSASSAPARPAGRTPRPEGQVATGDRQAVPEHPHEQQRVDVAAGEDDSHRGLERPRVVHQRSNAGRPGRLDDQLGPLEAEQQGPGQRLLGHGHDLVDQLADEGEGHLPGQPTAMPSAIVAIPSRAPGARRPAMPGRPPRSRPVRR